jgi:hypothetical protein
METYENSLEEATIVGKSPLFVNPDRPFSRHADPEKTSSKDNGLTLVVEYETSGSSGLHAALREKEEICG